MSHRVVLREEAEEELAEAKPWTDEPLAPASFALVWVFTVLLFVPLVVGTTRLVKEIKAALAAADRESGAHPPGARPEPD